jgi:small conductance mechanosensitive channel
VATINVSVDFSADPDKVTALLERVAMEIRTSSSFKDLFIADPQVLGVDSVKGSQVIFPVIFKTKAQQQYGPMREFQRRVRLALEQNHMLPGDPNRVFASFGEPSGGTAQGAGGASTAPRQANEPPPQAAHDPTTLKPQETNPFTGE